jgi:hypothetical protein
LPAEVGLIDKREETGADHLLDQLWRVYFLLRIRHKDLLRFVVKCGEVSGMFREAKKKKSGIGCRP